MPIGWWFLAGWTLTLTLGVLKLHQSTGDSDEYDLHTLGLCPCVYCQCANVGWSHGVRLSYKRQVASTGGD